MNLIFDIDSTSRIEVEESINETTGTKDKKYKVRGVFSTIGEKNRNGRIYPKEIWEREVANYQRNFKEGSINTLMEWDHPARSEVDPMQAVAKINDLHIEGKYVIGEAVLLDNPKANQLKSLIDNDIKISVSSRGVGSVKNGIVENFKLITYDFVSYPSDFNATMNGMVESYKLNEGILDKRFEYDDFGNIVEVSEEQQIKSELNKPEVKKAVLTMFKDILSSFK